MRSLADALKSADPNSVALAHDCLMSRIDSHLTRAQLALGDVADILHNARWHHDLYQRSPRQAAREDSAQVIRYTDDFIQRFGVRAAGNRDYPALVHALAPSLRQVAEGDRHTSLQAAVARLEETEDSNLRGLQRAHRDCLTLMHD